jgi:hypothetical protein
MDELVNLAVVERVFLSLALLLPFAGLAAGAAWGAARSQARVGAIQGFIAGLLGPLIWVLWKLYNAIEDHYGLDSVKGLLINLALFICVGLIAGLLGRRVFRYSGIQVFRPTGDSTDPGE